MEGRVKLHRSSVENELYFSETFNKRHAWQDLVLNANHKDNTIFIRWNEINIKRGQIWWSEITMSKRWAWSRDKVRRFLKWLETRQQIEQQKSKVTTTITIVNYNKYQLNDTTDKTTDRQQTDSRQDTNKNVKKEKNEKKEILPTEGEKSPDKEYGSPEVNEILEIIKWFNNWICDWTIKKQRQFWKSLISKLKKINKVKNKEYTRSQYISWLLEVVSKNQYHRHKISWPEKIYYALAELIQVANETTKQEEKNSIPVLPWV